MPKQISIEIDGVRYRALPGAGTPDSEIAAGSSGHVAAGRSPQGEETMTMDDKTRETERPYGVIPQIYVRPRLLARCERKPFLVMLGAVAFITVVVFGITLHGLIAGAILAGTGAYALRKVAEYDPYFFAVWWENHQYPRYMPAVLPDPAVPDYLHIEDADPATRRLHTLRHWAVFVAWCAFFLVLFGGMIFVFWLYLFA